MLEVHKVRKVKYKKRRRRRLLIYIFLTIFSICALVGGRYFYLYKRESNIVRYLKNMGKGEYDIRILKDEREAFENSLEIKNLNYEFDDNLKFGNTPKGLVFHHTASGDLSPEIINKDHKEKGWGGIGYHFYIRKDGTIYRGRPEECIGAHAIGRNYDSIGICLEGNFEEDKPTEKQEESLINLSVDMIIKYNLVDSIGHRDVYETLCPGKNFSMEDIENRIVAKIINLY